MKKYISKGHYIAMAIMVLIISMFIIACDEPNSSTEVGSEANPSDEVGSENGGSKSWKQVATGSPGSNTLFSERSSYTSVIDSAGNIYVIGGFDGSNLNDVWKSADEGKTWTQVNPGGASSNTLFSARYSHTSVIDSAGNIYVIGGNDGSNLNDVWKSADEGKTWTQVNTGSLGSGIMFSGRNTHTSVIDSAGNIYVIGGKGSSYFNDVWKSADEGKTWTQVATGSTSSNTLFSARRSHTSVIDSADNVYVIGGYDGSSNLNDVWKSADEGNTWTQVNPGGASSNTLFSARSSHTSVIDSAGNIYVIGGDDGRNFNDVWKSADKGKTWTQVNPEGASSNTLFSGRGGHTSVIDSAGNIYVIGGYDDSRLNDVWRYGY